MKTYVIVPFDEEKQNPVEWDHVMFIKGAKTAIEALKIFYLSYYPHCTKLFTYTALKLN